MDFHEKDDAIIRKQSFADVLQSRCSEKFRNILRKTPVFFSLLNVVAGLKASLHRPEKRLWFSCEHCEILKSTHFYRTPPVAAFLLSYCFSQRNLFCAPVTI